MDNFAVTPFTYLDGVPTLKDSDLEWIYRKTIKDGVGYIFSDGRIDSAEKFAALMKTPENALYVLTLDSQPVAYVWFNRFQFQGRIAQGHFCAFKEIWGKKTKEVGREFLKRIFSQNDQDGRPLFDMFYGFLPKYNKIALDFALAIGFEKVGEFPAGIWNDVEKRSEPGVVVTVVNPRSDPRNESLQTD